MSSLDAILAIVRERLPGVAAAVVPFGSRVIFPGHLGGDVDIVVILAGKENDVIPRGKIPEEMQRVRRALVEPDLDNDDAPVLEIKKSLPKARIPLLKVIHVPSQTPIDLVIHLGHPIVSSWFLRDIVQASDVGKKLVELVRNWCASKNITRADAGMLPKYGYSLLVVAFLQKKGLLPANLFPTAEEEAAPKAKRARLLAAGLDPTTYYTEGELIRFVALEEPARLLPWSPVLDAWQQSNAIRSKDSEVDELFQQFLMDLEGELSSEDSKPVTFREKQVAGLDEFKDTSDHLFVLRDPITSRNVACVLTLATKVAILSEIARARHALSSGSAISDLLSMKPLMTL
ncbi:hypothetical protein FOZ63_029515 [Perkinsus olseni]|uniref:Uncharacterized protein n=1 Tax=Perkinsus olseni TaxID=32597 RepID=A0A7J6QGJ3_PEROL|nr:hypothetical protein FOZ63_029515 [Perkinsus olseni]KAF4751502.1 hypothetical protein FOZ62_030582 [Perkinsus olseni]